LLKLTSFVKVKYSTNKCTDLACTLYCGCQGGQTCKNESGQYEHEEDWCLQR